MMAGIAKALEHETNIPCLGPDAGRVSFNKSSYTVYMADAFTHW